MACPSNSRTHDRLRRNRISRLQKGEREWEKGRKTEKEGEAANARRISVCPISQLNSPSDPSKGAATRDMAGWTIRCLYPCWVELPTESCSFIFTRTFLDICYQWQVREGTLAVHLKKEDNSRVFIRDTITKMTLNIALGITIRGRVELLMLRSDHSGDSS